MELPVFESIEQVKRYALKLIKLLQNQRRRPKSLSMADAYQQGVQQGAEDQQGDYGEQDEHSKQAEFGQGLAEIYGLGLAPEEQAVEVNALMNKRFSCNVPPRGRSARPPQRGAGFRRQPPRSASAPVRPPPRDRADVQCANCNRKGGIRRKNVDS